jgi:hypothetical protein
MKSSKIVVFLVAFMMMPIIGSYTKGISHKTTLLGHNEVSVTLETLTVYNPEKRQCDRTPLITASNARIDTEKLLKQEIRWMALSRDLLKRWKGKFHYGDTVRLQSGDPEIDGLWVIQDNLNKRFKSAGDLLFDGRVRKLGKWKNVTITRQDEYTITSTPEVNS